MDLDEADATIAAFMGWTKVPGFTFCYFAIPAGMKWEAPEDLSAFWRREAPSHNLADMPLVWKALNVKYIKSDYRGFGGVVFGVKIVNGRKFHMAEAETIESAAAIATAKAILNE